MNNTMPLHTWYSVSGVSRERSSPSCTPHRLVHLDHPFFPYLGVCSSFSSIEHRIRTTTRRKLPRFPCFHTARYRAPLLHRGLSASPRWPWQVSRRLCPKTKAQRPVYRDPPHSGHFPGLKGTIQGGEARQRVPGRPERAETISASAPHSGCIG